MNLKTRMPLVPLGNSKLVVLIGTPEVEIGVHPINVRDLSTMDTHRDLFVDKTLVCMIKDIPLELLEAFGHKHFSAMREDISDRFRIGMPAEAFVTLVFLQDSILPAEVLPNTDEVFDPEIPLLGDMPSSYLDEDDVEYEDDEDDYPFDN